MSLRAKGQRFLTILVVHQDKAARENLVSLYLRNLHGTNPAYCCRLRVTIYRSKDVEDAMKKFNNGLKVDLVIFAEDFNVGQRNLLRGLLSSLDLAIPFRMIPLSPLEQKS